MKRAIPSIIATGLILLGFGVMWARAYTYIRENEMLTEANVIRPLSLKEVIRTNVSLQPGVDYSIVYHIRTYRQTQGLRIIKKEDTTAVWMHAESQKVGIEATQVKLPKPLDWGTLNWR